MLVNRLIFYIYIFLLIVAGYLLFFIKSEVQNFNFQMNVIEEQIDQERDNIKLLKTELSVLTSPNRIKALSSKHLKLSEAKVNQMDYVDNSKVQYVAAANNGKWRYKGESRNNTRMVSYRR